MGTINASLALLVAMGLAVSPSIAAAEQALSLEPAPLRSEKAEMARYHSANPTASDDAAQSSQGPTLATQAQPLSVKKQFFKGLLNDQKAIWRSPLRIRKSDVRWLIPIAAATAAMISTDKRASAKVGDSMGLLHVSRSISHLGASYSTLGAAATAYIVGVFSNSDKAKRIGSLGLKAVINSHIVVGGLKLAANRERPSQRLGDGRFWAGGTSFPSGHAAFSWALATVISEEYREKPLTFCVYGLAAAVSVSRFTARRHFPSDVLAGGVLGHLIGRYVVRHHSAPGSGRQSIDISPYYSQPTRARGVAIFFGF